MRVAPRFLPPVRPPSLPFILQPNARITELSIEDTARERKAERCHDCQMERKKRGRERVSCTGETFSNGQRGVTNETRVSRQRSEPCLAHGRVMHERAPRIRDVDKCRDGGSEGAGRSGKAREVTAVRKLLFKIGIPLRLVGTRNADGAEATKIVSGRDEVAGGTEEMRLAEKGNVRYCFIIKESFLRARESF